MHSDVAKGSDIVPLNFWVLLFELDRQTSGSLPDDDKFLQDSALSEFVFVKRLFGIYIQQKTLNCICSFNDI
jgi:hypothetical protein